MTGSKVIKALFTLLRSGLWEKSIDDLNCFPLNEKEWEVLYKIAVEQTVEGLIYDGIQNLPLDFFPTRSLMLKWVVRVNRIEVSNTKMNNCIKEQILFFNKLNVSPILLKGQGIGYFYPVQNHRICGDIDWYFDDVEHSKLVEKELKAKKLHVVHPTIDSYNYVWRSCEVEHHTKLFDVFNPLARYKLTSIKQEELYDQKMDTEGSLNYNTLPPNLNIIQVNLHILKHLLSFGIGLRQFCDSAILYAKLDHSYDKGWLSKVYKDIGVINWINVLHHLLVKYIGLSKDKLPFELKENICSEWMVKDVIATGNFGFHDEKHITRQEDNKIERRNKSGRLWYSFQQYLPLAPYEAISFPVVHFFERFKSLTVG